MLDINLFRVDKGGDPEALRQSQRRRGKPVEQVDAVIALDKEWVKLRFDVDEANKKANALQVQIASKMKGKEDAKELIEERQRILKDKEDVEVRMKAKEQERDAILCSMGNVVHASVVTSMDEKDNDVIRTWFKDGKEPTKVEGFLATSPGPCQAGWIRPGEGCKGLWASRLLPAIRRCQTESGPHQLWPGFLVKQGGYTPIQTPFMMRKEMMAKCAQLEDFDEQLYKVVVAGDVQDAGAEDKYLIATSEQPLTVYHADEWFEEPSKELPLCYAGYSTCFRKEAGSHGRDTWGLFRIHQFEKVEQFVICEPEKSWEMFDRMIGLSEQFYQSLGLSYRVVGIVSGALNNAAAKKYDLEAWFPNYADYKELVSCSNCTDYHSRRLEIRCGPKKMGDREKKYVHCLNCTLSATERTLCCILENYQTKEGLTIPEVLRPYMGGQEFIPYVKDLLAAPKK